VPTILGPCVIFHNLFFYKKLVELEGFLKIYLWLTKKIIFISKYTNQKQFLSNLQFI